MPSDIKKKKRSHKDIKHKMSSAFKETYAISTMKSIVPRMVQDRLNGRQHSGAKCPPRGDEDHKSESASGPESTRLI
jgi:hypothetical protein